jgi:uncharacterized protein
MSRLATLALQSLVRGYQLLLRHWLGAQCRFSLRCSDYALQALDQHGAAAGSYLAARRVLRCHPWCAGGDDPVPQQFRFFHLTRFSKSKAKA